MSFRWWLKERWNSFWKNGFNIHHWSIKHSPLSSPVFAAHVYAKLSSGRNICISMSPFKILQIFSLEHSKLQAVLTAQSVIYVIIKCCVFIYYLCDLFCWIVVCFSINACRIFIFILFMLGWDKIKLWRSFLQEALKVLRSCNPLVRVKCLLLPLFKDFFFISSWLSVARRFDGG